MYVSTSTRCKTCKMCTKLVFVWQRAKFPRCAKWGSPGVCEMCAESLSNPFLLPCLVPLPLPDIVTPLPSTATRASTVSDSLPRGYITYFLPSVVCLPASVRFYCRDQRPPETRESPPQGLSSSQFAELASTLPTPTFSTLSDCPSFSYF